MLLPLRYAALTTLMLDVTLPPRYRRYKDGALLLLPVDIADDAAVTPMLPIRYYFDSRDAYAAMSERRPLSAMLEDTTRERC